MDIVIYMNEEDFRHKTDSEMYHCYWSMGRIPKQFNWTIELADKEKEDVVYFACKGFVRGLVRLEEFNPADIGGETIVWDGVSFQLLKKLIPCKPFRGFRYRWW